MRMLRQKGIEMPVNALAFILSSVFAATVFASPSEVSVDAPSNTAQIPDNWTGWFVGGSVGHSWGSSDVDYVQAPGGFFGLDINSIDSAFAAKGDFNPKGGNGGFLGGYNHQRGKFVFGIVADFDYRLGGEKATTGPIFPPLDDFLSISTTQKWLGTLRARVGLTPCKACLIYATGGLGYGKVRHAVVQTAVFEPIRSFDSKRAFSDSPIKVGWTVGGGVEYRLDQNWSFAAEYLYVDLGSDTIGVGPSAGNDASNLASFYPATRVSTDDSSSIARVMLNYRFDGP